ncbi:rhamnan synthesis F family protein [Rhodobacter maris]|uniref:rhamnan synthesis F family protein n=1 Tax=Rhodobacter maris TaxID=446682 RepID=UPI001596859B|nr:rhamnan synthesis F family protein [Rhodobacter maris]
MPGSILETCRYLGANDYSVVLVSNGALPPASRDSLRPHCRSILERPNFGYDFGGYRDGIHFLQRQGLSPSHLILLNDSIWFPMVSDSQVIGRLEASALDVCGLLLRPRRRGEAKRAFGRRHQATGPSEFLESYLIHLRQPVWESETFRRFWRDYKQSSSKWLTIKRGEIGFSKALQAGGFSVGALSGLTAFIDAISQQGAPFLDKALHYAAAPGMAFPTTVPELAEFGQEGAPSDQKRAYIIAIACRERFNASFCWATETLFETHFVKKHNSALFRMSREKYLEAIDAGDIRADAPAALEEIRRRVHAARGLES